MQSVNKLSKSSFRYLLLLSAKYTANHAFSKTTLSIWHEFGAKC